MWAAAVASCQCAIIGYFPHVSNAWKRYASRADAALLLLSFRISLDLSIHWR